MFMNVFIILRCITDVVQANDKAFFMLGMSL